MSKKPRRDEYTMTGDEMHAAVAAAQDIEEAVATPAQDVPADAPAAAINPLPDINPSGKFGVVLITAKHVRLFVPPGGGWIDYDTALEWSKTHYSEGEMYHVIAIEIAS